MSWSTENSANMTFLADSMSAFCIHCLSTLPQIYAAALTSISLLGLPLEVWSIWLLFSLPITEKTDLLSFNVLFSDLLLHLANLFIMLNNIVFHRPALYTWSFLLCLIAFGKPLFQCFICVERYFAVEYPIVFLRYRPLRYRVAIVAPSWIILLLIFSVTAALCASQVSRGTPFLFFQCTVMILVFVINSFCYMSILRALIRPPPGDRSKAKAGGKQKKDILKIKKKAFIIITGVQAYVVICYVPPITLMFSRHLMDDRVFCGLYLLNMAFVLMSSCLFCLQRIHNSGKLKWMNCTRKK